MASLIRLANDLPMSVGELNASSCVPNVNPPRMKCERTASTSLVAIPHLLYDGITQMREIPHLEKKN